METKHTLIIGDSQDMPEIEDESIHLVVTSPPYFNAPFDYKDLYNSYDDYLTKMSLISIEIFRVIQTGRIAVIVIDDMLVNGEKFPIVADITKVYQAAGFRYRDRIIWKKPNGYIRISRRSGVILQNPYPMYYYPDNLTETILIFQKGKFDYRAINEDIRQKSKIDVKEFKQNKWFMSHWEITNVLPIKRNSLSKGISAFPDEIPYRIIKLFSYEGETVLDPFVGSGTTMKIANALNRNSIGIEILPDLVDVIIEKSNISKADNDNETKLSVIFRK